MIICIQIHKFPSNKDKILRKFDLPKNVEHIYSEIWFPDLLDSLKCESSLLSMRLNCEWVKEMKNSQSIGVLILCYERIDCYR